MKVAMNIVKLTAMLFIINITGRFAISTKEVYVKAGAQYVFECPYRKLSSNNMIWGYTNKTGSYFQISDGIYVASNYPGKARATIVGDHINGEYNLQLSGIQESDEGLYQCSVNNGGSGGIQNGYFSLYMKVPPTSLTLYGITDNHIIGTEGQSLTLNCTGTGGKPPPEIRLIVGGTTTTGIQTVVYTIPVLQRSHDKQSVTCQGNSTALDSPLSKSTSLYLNLKPSTLTFSPDHPTANETQQLTLSCTSVGSRPAAVFNWKLKGALMTSGITQQNILDPSTDTYTVMSTLTHNVDRTYNGQSITCGVTHLTITGSLQTTKTLSVQYAPGVTVENKTYAQQDTTRTILCIPSGNPTTYTYYRWQHRSMHGKLIRELDRGHNGVLTLPDVPESQRYQDTGEYVCSVSNGIGDRNGLLKQTGSGYVIVRAQPVFTLDNAGMNIQYGEIGKDRDIHVFVYSLPKCTSVKWLKGSKGIIASSKYSFSDTPMVVRDDFNTTKVNLDGYRLTLTISNLQNEDFDNYMVQLSNGYGQTVQRGVILKFGSTPDIPTTFYVIETTESSILVEWDPGLSGGFPQTIHLQYRQIGSVVWLSGGIFNVSTSIRQNHTLTGLQAGTEFELRMFAMNDFNQSLPTDIRRASTKIKASHDMVSGEQFRGVVGCLVTVIVVLVIVLVLGIKRHRDMLRLLNGNKPFKTNRDKYEPYQNQPTSYEEIGGSSNVFSKIDTRSGEVTCGSAVDTYEMLNQEQQSSGPNMYDDLSFKKGEGNRNIQVRKQTSHLYI